MRFVLRMAALAIGLGALSGCSADKTTPASDPPPDVEAEKAAKGPRIPPPPK
jgi:hypothetical protein